MAHDKVFGICENKCLVETVPKQGGEFTGTLTLGGTGSFQLIEKSLITYDQAVTGWTRIYQAEVLDSNGKSLGYSQRGRSIAGDGSTYDHLTLSVRNKGATAESTLKIIASENGTKYIEAPTPSSPTDSTTKIATTGWVNNIDNDVVHKSRNETIAGNKTFNGTLSTGAFTIYGNDSTGRKQIFTRPYGNADQHQVGWLIDNNLSYCAINIVANLTNPLIKIGNQNIPAYATAPSSTANGDEIATAGWVNNKLATRVQKIALTGTISNGTLSLTNVQDGDVVVLTVMESDNNAPKTYTFPIPSSDMATSLGNRAMAVQSHIMLDSSDSAVYGVIVSVLYSNGWGLSQTKVKLSDGTYSQLAISKFEGYILRG